MFQQNQSNTFRASCGKCGYRKYYLLCFYFLINKSMSLACCSLFCAGLCCCIAGHFTYQCRNFFRVNPSEDIVLDVSSTTSFESDDDREVNKRNHNYQQLSTGDMKKKKKQKKLKKKKKKHEKKAKRRHKKHSESDSDSDKSSSEHLRKPTRQVSDDKSEDSVKEYSDDDWKHRKRLRSTIHYVPKRHRSRSSSRDTRNSDKCRYRSSSSHRHKNSDSPRDREKARRRRSRSKVCLFKKNPFPFINFILFLELTILTSSFICFNYHFLHNKNITM